MSSIRFAVALYTIDSWTIVQLPLKASKQLSSRGLNMAEVSVDGHRFTAPLEPDGQGSHWFSIDQDLLAAIRVQSGDTVNVEITPMADWPRPDMPHDIRQGIDAVPEAQALWQQITPKAQWEWLRWIRATNRLETRQRRIEVACSKMQSGMRRPCCFNSSMCTEPAVSKNGVLLAPASIR